MSHLFESALAGDPAAEMEISRRLRVLARAICRPGGVTSNPAVDWEDVAQEAAKSFFAAGIRRYRGQGSEDSYLYTFVKTTVLQVVRSAERRKIREDASTMPEAGPPDRLLDRLETGSVLARLPGPCRNLLIRVFLHDERYAELSRELGIEESSVRARVSRCLRRARLLARKEQHP